MTGEETRAGETSLLPSCNHAAPMFRVDVKETRLVARLRTVLRGKRVCEFYIVTTVPEFHVLNDSVKDELAEPARRVWISASRPRKWLRGAGWEGEAADGEGRLYRAS